MICPYCGEYILSPNKEHFFPQMIYPNDWDFFVCRECNKLKGQHIVYPSGELFKLLPAELNIEKFKYLWSISGNIKYLNIVPTKQVVSTLACRKWDSGDYLFNVQERQFYGLDRLKKIYDYYVNYINTMSGITALILSEKFRWIYLVHTYQEVLTSPFPEVRTLKCHEYVNAGIRGWLMYGSAKNGIWRSVHNYTEYFNKLLGAPYTIDMM